MDGLDAACAAHDHCYRFEEKLSCGCDNALIKAAKHWVTVPGNPGKQARKIVAFFRLLPCRGAQTFRFPAICKSRKKILRKRITISRPCIKRTCKVIPIVPPGLKKRISRLSCKKNARAAPKLCLLNKPCGGCLCTGVCHNTNDVLRCLARPPKPTPTARPSRRPLTKCEKAVGTTYCDAKPCPCGLHCTAVDYGVNVSLEPPKSPYE